MQETRPGENFISISPYFFGPNYPYSGRFVSGESGTYTRVVAQTYDSINDRREFEFNPIVSYDPPIERGVNPDVVLLYYVHPSSPLFNYSGNVVNLDIQRVDYVTTVSGTVEKTVTGSIAKLYSKVR